MQGDEAFQLKPVLLICGFTADLQIWRTLSPYRQPLHGFLRQAEALIAYTEPPDLRSLQVTTSSINTPGLYCFPYLPNVSEPLVVGLVTFENNTKSLILIGFCLNLEPMRSQLEVNLSDDLSRC